MQWNTMQNIMHLNSHINIIDAGNVCLLTEDRLKNLYQFLWMMKFYGTFTLQMSLFYLTMIISIHKLVKKNNIQKNKKENKSSKTLAYY